MGKRLKQKEPVELPPEPFFAKKLQAIELLREEIEDMEGEIDRLGLDIRQKLIEGLRPRLDPIDAQHTEVGICYCPNNALHMCLFDTKKDPDLGECLFCGQPDDRP